MHQSLICGDFRRVIAASHPPRSNLSVICILGFLTCSSSVCLDRPLRLWTMQCTAEWTLTSIYCPLDSLFPSILPFRSLFHCYFPSPHTLSFQNPRPFESLLRLLLFYSIFQYQNHTHRLPPSWFCQVVFLKGSYSYFLGV